MSTLNQRKKELDYAYITPGSENEYLKISSGQAAWATIIQGATGVQGSTGDSNSGNRGFQGFTGQSASGVQGFTGGVQGTVGVQGIDFGVQGAAGPIVSAGPQGFMGFFGAQGIGGRITGQSAVLIQPEDTLETFQPVVRIGAGSSYAFDIMIFWSGTGPVFNTDPGTYYDFNLTSNYGSLGAYGLTERCRETSTQFIFTWGINLVAGFNRGLAQDGLTQRGWCRAMGYFSSDSTTNVSLTTVAHNAGDWQMLVRKGSYFKVYKLA